jgi:translocator protein
MRRFLFLGFTLAVIAVNTAANVIPIAGVTTGELSAQYPTGFTPAGWVFSIWSLIYAGLLALSVHALRARGAAAARLRRIEAPFIVSSLANMSWIFAWHFEFVAVSVGVMLVLLGSLVVMYARLREDRPASRTGWWLVDAPVSLYLGWITSATLVNFAALFFALQAWPFELDMHAWALVTVVLATALYAVAGTALRDPVYTGVFVWASLGIYLQRLPVTESVRLAALAACVALGLLTLVLVVRAAAGHYAVQPQATRAN